ncbi:hypothetical protein HGRIS_003284 [Hohenbuehelia grisea]|uniref:Uncharacterized protein n=1 Tax=Hohenbuehelia grisea TaxID=104357 RepID=A0ABR3JN80_9AGAR
MKLARGHGGHLVGAEVAARLLGVRLGETIDDSVVKIVTKTAADRLKDGKTGNITTSLVTWNIPALYQQDFFVSLFSGWKRFALL